MFSFFRSLTSGKTITRESMSSVLEKMKEHLISMCGCGLLIYLSLLISFIAAKNVAAEIADKLCASVAAKLEGKTIGTFSGERKIIKPYFARVV